MNADQLIAELAQKLNLIDAEIKLMEGNVEILNREPESKAYRRWYLSHRSIQNLEGLTTKALEDIREYNRWKNLPWWKRLFRKES